MGSVTQQSGQKYLMHYAKHMSSVSLPPSALEMALEKGGELKL